MTDCERLPNCPFFNGEMPIEEKLGETYQSYYCHNVNAICARYLVLKMLGKEAVPFDLYPDQLRRARKIIAAATNSHQSSDPIKS